MSSVASEKFNDFNLLFMPKEKMELHERVIPEELVERISSKAIDIEDFTGFCIRTQVANLESILSKGIQYAPGMTGKNLPRWGTQGTIIKKRSGGYFGGIYFSAIDAYASLEKWTSVPWEEAGQVLLLLDNNKMKTKPIEQVHEAEMMLPPEELKDSDLEAVIAGSYSSPTFRMIKTEVEIEPEVIKAIIISPRPVKLMRKKQSSRLSVQAGRPDEYITVTEEQALEVAKNRLTRLALSNKNAKPAPLYDHFGNMIWPKNIPHEVCQKIGGTKVGKRARLEAWEASLEKG